MVSAVDVDCLGYSHGRPIELVELTITRTVACSSKPSNIERSVSLRCEPTGMELIVLAIRILTG